MKRYLAISAIIALFAVMIPSAVAEVDAPDAYWNLFDGPNGSNYFADSVEQYASNTGTWTDFTSEAESTAAGDVTVGKLSGSEFWIGSEYEFDGFAIDFGTEATGGTYTVEYYSDDDVWVTVPGYDANTNNDDLEDDNSLYPLIVSWDERPDGWARTSGNTVSDTYFYVRVVLEGDYGVTAKADQVSLLVYNVEMQVIDETGASMVADLEPNEDIVFFDNGGFSDGYVYASAVDGDTLKLALNADSGSDTAYDFYIYPEGFVGQGGDPLGIVQGSVESLTVDNVEYSYFYAAMGGDGLLDIAEAEAGDTLVDCVIDSHGEAHCPVALDNDQTGSAYLYVDGYLPIEVALENRTSAADDQVAELVDVEEYAYKAYLRDGLGIGSNEVEGATVEAENESGDVTECVELGEGYYGCPVLIGTETISISVTKDGYEDFSGEFSNYRDSHDDEQVDDYFVLTDLDADDDGLTDTEEADLGTDPEDADSDDDGLTDAEEVNDYGTDPLVADSDDGGIDDGGEVANGTDPLDGDDDGVSEDDVDADGLTNDEEADLGTDPEDADSDNDGLSDGDEVDLGTDPLVADSDGGGTEDGDEVDAGTNPLDSDDDEADSDGDGLTDDDEEDTYGTDPDEADTDGDGVSDGDEVATGTDPLDENDYLADAPDWGLDCSHRFTDLGGFSWAEQAICMLYNNGIVNGRTARTFVPDGDITRAEFLKIMLLNAGYSPYAISIDTEFNDVSSDDWFYKYVTYGVYLGVVRGDGDGNFRPDDPINRAEAIVLIMRIYDRELWNWGETDIAFNDVFGDDWYAYATILGERAGIIKGYGDGDYGPEDNVTRAAAAVMARRAYYAYGLVRY